MRIAIGVEYAGTDYCGWQYQSHCESVQGFLQKAVSTIADEPIELHCAGRTDTGVHAIGQVVHFETHVDRPERAWVEGVNTHLPADIRVVWSKPMPDDFHARFSAEARQYRYVILNRRTASAVLARRVTWERLPLDENAMHQAGQFLLGEQDFSSFRAAGCQARHAVRNVQSVQVSRHHDFVFIDIQANAFLHHMVRNIAGALLAVGRGTYAPEWIQALLLKQDRTQGEVTAPASGLYFVNALYPEAFSVPRQPLDQVLWQA